MASSGQYLNSRAIVPGNGINLPFFVIRAAIIPDRTATLLRAAIIPAAVSASCRDHP